MWKNAISMLLLLSSAAAMGLFQSMLTDVAISNPTASTTSTICECKMRCFVQVSCKATTYNFSTSKCTSSSLPHPSDVKLTFPQPDVVTFFKYKIEPYLLLSQSTYDFTLESQKSLCSREGGVPASNMSPSLYKMAVALLQTAAGGEWLSDRNYALTSAQDVYKNKTLYWPNGQLVTGGPVTTPTLLHNTQEYYYCQPGNEVAAALDQYGNFNFFPIKCFYYYYLPVICLKYVIV
ncbi:uncharacterized protein LOC108678430 [Hyalella azteca]|uniref:Uncharacterized protein LOC108678430 n=1 Tax=Hyalella azteca TaxID=294128 RepID=A0A8B7PAW0_HYAAZ|nr:uncharacterized protein LOC108678430 [Hyalella azteca]XP_047738288.1 uncharacterized protein LOC108678430 [Hyalella azteca]